MHIALWSLIKVSTFHLTPQTSRSRLVGLSLYLWILFRRIIVRNQFDFKHRSYILVAFVLLLSFLFLTGCPGCDVAYAPENFPGTVWATEDGKITFTVEVEDVERFNGKTMISTVSYVDVQPLYTQMFGEIRIESYTIDIFIYSSPSAYYFAIISEDLPSEAGDEDYYDVYERYMLLGCDLNYKSSKHFVATVTESKIDEIPVGTVLDFYRTAPE